MSKLIIALAAIAVFSTDALGQTAEANRYRMTQPQPYYGPPPFPLFRCDGQRPPMVGAENCANWRVQGLQEQVLREQLYQLRKQRLRPKADTTNKVDTGYKGHKAEYKAEHQTDPGYKDYMDRKEYLEYKGYRTDKPVCDASVITNDMNDPCEMK